MYTPKYFTIEECFPPDQVRHWKGAGDKIWQVFDGRILKAADLLREEFGPMWINGHGFTQCGYRTNVPETSRSQHRFGRALDLHPMETTSKRIREFLIKNQEHAAANEYITFLETDINWLHIDCRNHSGDILLWSPKRGWVDYQNGDPIDE